MDDGDICALKGNSESKMGYNAGQVNIYVGTRERPKGGEAAKPRRGP